MSDSAHPQWKGNTGGNKWMQRSLIFWYRIIDIRLYYTLLALVVPFYMVFNRSGYKAMKDYFRNSLHYGPVKTFFSIYRNHFVFGEIILDRFAMYAGKKYSLSIDNYELFQSLSESEQGFVVLSSHVGNYELAGYSLISKKKVMYALVYEGETETVMKNRHKMFDGHNIELIPVKDDMSHLFFVNNALISGDIVSMPADRIFGSTKHVECDFLGRKTIFPLGPFALAVNRKVPVIAVFVMKESIGRYSIHIKRIDRPDELDKNAQIKCMTRNYVNELGNILKSYPCQWFNYYDFWNQQNSLS